MYSNNDDIIVTSDLTISPSVKPRVYYDDRLLNGFKWTMTAATAYALVWTIIFGVYRYDTDKTCGTAELVLFGTIAFWLLLVSTVVLLICIIWLWGVKSFRNVKLAETIGFNCVGLLFIPLWLVVLVWGYVVGAKNANAANCGGLFYGAWVFAILTSVYIVLDCIEICVIGAFVGKDYVPKKDFTTGSYRRKDNAQFVPVSNEVNRVINEPTRTTVSYNAPAGSNFRSNDGAPVNYYNATSETTPMVISSNPVGYYERPYQGQY
jgi:hypothetical protein